MNKATGTVFKAIGTFGSIKMLSIVCSLVRNKLIAVWVGPVGLGLVILYNSISDTLSVATRLNIDQSAVRTIAKAGEAAEAGTAAVVHRWSVLLGVAGALIMCALSPLLSLWSFGTADNWWSFCVLSVMPLSYSVSMGYQSVMQGMRRFGSLARVGLVTALAGIAVSVPLIWWLRDGSILWVIVIYGLVMLAASWALRVRLPRVRIPWRQMWQTGSEFIRLGAFITVGSVVTYLANYVFVLLLQNFTSTSTLGLYQAGYTIISSYVGVLFTGLWMEYYPRLASMTGSAWRTSVTVSHRIVITSLVLMPVVAVFVSVDELLVRIVYSGKFLPMVPYLTIGMAATVLRAASWCMAHCMLARGDGHVYALTESVSAVICVALNFAGYMLWGFEGLGVAFILWYGLYLGIVWAVYRRRYGLGMRRGVMPLMWLSFAFAVAAACAKMLLGWWVPLLMGAAVSPLVLKRLLK
ncbi:MAG: oligosaccharide flippase family protein [Muribaculaceae bacterium]|nr:oligosaccharide flippase family protein [Muribaculaceae bacterium]